MVHANSFIFSSVKIDKLFIIDSPNSMQLFKLLSNIPVIVSPFLFLFDLVIWG